MIKTETKIPQPDKNLIRKCRNGDTNAFKSLVEMMQHYAYYLAFKILLNEDDAKDSVQETFVKIWKNIDNYRDEYLFSTWMYKIVVNTCLDKIKGKKNNISLKPEHEDSHNAAETSIINRDLIRQIKILSKDLPYKQRIIFILKDLQGLSFDEVAKVLDMPKGRIKSNLYYARKNIRDKLFKIENRRNYNAV